ncbi:MAG: hypothetical protein IT323_14160 [Anaerolineae bacterium]|nr:hypothetical protein [Anaerolineae bacterium]
MTFPAFYSPDKAAAPFEPDLEGAYRAGLADFQRSTAADRPRVLALLIDVQNDFVFPAPTGRLPVPGAVDDTRRTVEWLYRNVQRITTVAVSLDTHTPIQIFFPSWWKDASGDRPAPFTTITAQDVRDGRWIPAQAPHWSRRYVEELEQVGRKQLVIWPFHCIEGTAGRALHPSLSEAIAYHSGARDAEPVFVVKGMIPYTEFYSAFEPEVKYPEHRDGGVNTRFLDQIAAYDEVYITGQARSHCVLESLGSIVNYFSERPEVLSRIRFLQDTSSSIPGFEEHAEKRLAEFAAAGLQFVSSVG